jgi:DNA repair protein RecO (recombination protein O)
MPGPVKTEAVVLRSMRYGEADRILHVYTPHRGRVSAIAKGVRRARSRFGGRLEPFFRLRLELHEGRGEILTVTGAQTVEGYPRLREDARALDAAARACDAVGRLFETPEPHPAVFNLLCRRLSLLDRRGGCAPDAGPGDTASRPAEEQRGLAEEERGLAGEQRGPAGEQRGPAGRRRGPAVAGGSAEGSPAGRAAALQFRLKLLHAAGLAPHLGACACCGEREHLVGFSGAAGGVVCGACEASSFPLGEAAHSFMTEALGRPLAETPHAAEQVLGQVERALSETLEHHAHVRLMPAVARGG